MSRNIIDLAGPPSKKQKSTKIIIDKYGAHYEDPMLSIPDSQVPYSPSHDYDGDGDESEDEVKQQLVFHDNSDDEQTADDEDYVPEADEEVIEHPHTILQMLKYVRNLNESIEELGCGMATLEDAIEAMQEKKRLAARKIRQAKKLQQDFYSGSLQKTTLARSAGQK